MKDTIDYECKGELGHITEVWITGQRFIPAPPASDTEVVRLPSFYRVRRGIHYYLLRQSEVDALCNFRADEIASAAGGAQ